MSTPTKYHVLNVPQSPVAASPSKNLTGTARVARDIIADIYNTIQKWNDSQIKGAEVVKEIAVLCIDGYSNELETQINKLYGIVNNLNVFINNLNSSKNQITALEKVDKKNEFIFISLLIKDIVILIETVVNAYCEEFKIKEMVLENIAHSRNEDEIMFFAALWTYQVFITDKINRNLEILLLESGHRKI